MNGLEELLCHGLLSGGGIGGDDDEQCPKTKACRGIHASWFTISLCCR